MTLQGGVPVAQVAWGAGKCQAARERLVRYDAARIREIAAAQAAQAAANRAAAIHEQPARGHSVAPE